MKKYIAAVTLAIMALGACGGGGGEEPSATAKYVGSYASCDGNHVRQYLTITESSKNNLSIKLLEKVYQYAECSGTILGWIDYSAPTLFTYSGTKAATVYGYPAWYKWNTAEVDTGRAYTTGGPILITGPGVKIIKGDTCVVWSNGMVCRDTTSIAGEESAGMILFNGLLYSASLKIGSGGPYYNVDSIDIKQ